MELNITSNPVQKTLQSSLSQVLSGIAPEHISVDTINIRDQIAVKVTEHSCDPQSRIEFQNALDFLGAKPAGRILPLPRANPTEPQSLTVNLTPSPELESRLGLLNAFQKGRAYVHFMELPPYKFTLEGLEEKILSPLVGLMSGQPHIQYNDYGLLGPKHQFRLVHSAPDRGVTALAGRALKAHIPVPTFEDCQYGLMFNGTDHENVRPLFFTDRDAKSVCIQKDKMIDPHLYIHDGHYADPEILSLQHQHKPGEGGDYLLPVHGDDKQVQGVERALDHYWNTIQPIGSALDHEIDFNAKIRWALSHHAGEFG